MRVVGASAAKASHRTGKPPPKQIANVTRRKAQPTVVAMTTRKSKSDQVRDEREDMDVTQHT
jgi:hypothetical protein